MSAASATASRAADPSRNSSKEPVTPIASIFSRISLCGSLRLGASAAKNLARCSRIFAIITVALVFSSVAGAQSVPIVQPAGPLTPAQMEQAKNAQQTEQLLQIANQMGIPLSSGKPGADGDGHAVSDPSAVPLPDATQILPTTTEPRKLSASVEILLLLSLLTLAPSILLMTTCFTRIIIVMSLLRQAIGAAQLPPNQVLVGLSLFMTFMVMTPTWTKINEQAVVPYNNQKLTQGEAFSRAHEILREFMIKQIQGAHNENDVYMFYGFAHPNSSEPQEFGQVESTVLVPAFILSELKVAFLMGFRIYLPFLIIDMVISSVLISIGMQLLPPVMVSLPFKLLLFVLVDGWHLVCGTLLASFS